MLLPLTPLIKQAAYYADMTSKTNVCLLPAWPPEKVAKWQKQTCLESFIVCLVPEAAQIWHKFT